METLHDKRLTDERLGDDEIVDVERMIVFRVGDGALQRLLHRSSNTLAGEFEIREGGLDRLAANKLRQQIQLLRADAQHAGNTLGFIVLKGARGFRLRHRVSLSSLSCPPRDHGRCAWGRIRRTCG